MTTIIYPALQQAVDDAARRCLVQDGVCQHCGLHLPECDWCDRKPSDVIVQSEAEMMGKIWAARDDAASRCKQPGSRCLFENGWCRDCGRVIPGYVIKDAAALQEDEARKNVGYKLNTDRSVAVATDTYCSTDMSACPRGCKVYLIGKGGVGHLAVYDGDPFWIEWAPLPKRARK